MRYLLLLFILVFTTPATANPDSEWTLLDTWRPILRGEVVFQTDGIDSKKFYAYDIGLKYTPSSKITWEAFYQNQFRMEEISAVSRVTILERRQFFVTFKIKY